MIKINDKYYIDADARNYTLKQKTIVKSKEGIESEGFKELGFYTTLDGLFNGLLKTELREYIKKSENEDIDKLLNKIKEIEILLKDKLKEV